MPNLPRLHFASFSPVLFLMLLLVFFPPAPVKGGCWNLCSSRAPEAKLLLYICHSPTLASLLKNRLPYNQGKSFWICSDLATNIWYSKCPQSLRLCFLFLFMCWVGFFFFWRSTSLEAWKQFHECTFCTCRTPLQCRSVDSACRNWEGAEPHGSMGIALVVFSSEARDCCWTWPWEV